MPEKLKAVAVADKELPTVRRLQGEELEKTRQSYEELMGRSLSDVEVEEIDGIASVFNGNAIVKGDYPRDGGRWRNLETLKGKQLTKFCVHPHDFARMANKYSRVIQQFKTIQNAITSATIQPTINRILQHLQNVPLEEVDVRDQAYVLDVLMRAKCQMDNPEFGIFATTFVNNLQGVKEVRVLAVKMLMGDPATQRQLEREFEHNVDKFLGDGHDIN